MIELSTDIALAGVVTVMVVVIAWGAAISSRTVTRGPEWTVGHLRRVQPLIPVAMVAAVACAALVRPLWMGALMVYLVGTAWWLVWSMRRSMERVEAAGGFGALDPDRRAMIVRKARNGLWVAGVVLIVVALATRLPTAVEMGLLAVAAVTIANGVAVWRSAG